jgi:hypothetical protein
MIANTTQLAHIALQAELLAVEARAVILAEEDAAELLRMVANCLLFISQPMAYEEAAPISLEAWAALKPKRLPFDKKE